MNYHIITYGCQMNEADSERLTAKLEQENYQLVDNIESADLVVINVCSIRQSAINRVQSKIKKIREIRQQNKNIRIILTGCILDKDKQRFQEQVDEIWPIVGFDYLPQRQFLKRAYVPIMNGCNNFCAYCAVPYTRGREISRPVQDIIKEIEYLVQKNYQEIILLGQNVNSYHSQKGAKKIDFPKLLELICNISGDFKIKFLTSHPKDMSERLIAVIAANEKLAKEIHLPVQSGDDDILKQMNRQYTISHYKKLVWQIIAKIPQVQISTDIIVGFPGETEQQFQNTAKLVDEIKFSQAYVSCYSPRPGTMAAKLKDTVPANEKKKRKSILLDKFKRRFC